MDSLVKPLTWILGLVLTIVGIVGFFMDPVIAFNVNAAHNIVHLVSGIAALLCAFNGYSASRWFLIIFGIVYGLVTILGFAGVAFVVSLLDINAADNWLHLAISAVCLIAGFGSRGNVSMA